MTNQAADAQGLLLILFLFGPYFLNWVVKKLGGEG